MNKGLWVVSTKHIPYLKAQNAKGNHILIQPAHWCESRYMMADDLNKNQIQIFHRFPEGKWKPGRMIIETSPGNFQVWIHSSRYLSLDEKRYWLKRMKSDPGADPHHRWGRCPGFFNRKDKYRSQNGNYPLAKLIWVDWMNETYIPKISKPIPKENNQHRGYNNRYLYGKCTRRIHYERHNESATDFAYALALARRNFSKQQIIYRLLEERRDWTNHRGESRKIQYTDRTVTKAINIVANSNLLQSEDYSKYSGNFG
ncbi:MAG: DNA-primase RepB domain-containing protein [Methanosarcinaceae archaeon]